jgi:hypothetical protein
MFCTTSGEIGKRLPTSPGILQDLYTLLVPRVKCHFCTHCPPLSQGRDAFLTSKWSPVTHRSHEGEELVFVQTPTFHTYLLSGGLFVCLFACA